MNFKFKRKYFISFNLIFLILLMGCSSHKHTLKDYEYDDHLHWRECEVCHEKEEFFYHTYSPWTIVIAPTETEDGLRKQVCNACGFERTEVVLPVAHTHQYGEWKIVEAPTKTSFGKIARACELDPSHKEEADLPALNIFSYHYMLISEATCSYSGLERYDYYKDGEIFSFEVNLPIKDHPYSEKWFSNSLGHYHLSTCEHIGVESDFEPHSFLNGYCLVCDFEEPVETHEHSFGEWKLVEEPTLTSEGQVIRTCLTNNEHTESFILPTLNQNDYKFQELSASTCEIQGNASYTYEKDGATFTFEASLPYAEHPFAERWTNDNINHWHAALCSHNTEKKDQEQHQFDKGKCVICGFIDYTENLIYELNEDESSYSIVGIHSLTETQIVIPSRYLNLPITKIKESAFRNSTAIEYVKIWDGVVEIEDYAFANCINLSEIIFPNTLKSIGSNSFANCSKLTDVILYEGFESLETYAFYGCQNLKTISIPSSINYIGNRALSDTALMGTQYEAGCYLGNEDNPYLIFYKPLDLGVQDYIVHDNTVFIYDYVFSQNHSIVSIIIPKSVQFIGKNSFSSCEVLQYIYYMGTEEDYQRIKVDTGNTIEEYILYYSDNPSLKGEWGFDENHIPYPYE